MRTVSSTFKEAVFARETDEVIICLLTIDHDDAADGPYYFSSDAVNTVSRGNTYYAYPFEITLPGNDPAQPPRAKIRIDNILRELVEVLRTISTPLDVTIELVLASDPDTVEVSFEGFQIMSVNYDALTVEGELSFVRWERDPYPKGLVTPKGFPGTF